MEAEPQAGRLEFLFEVDAERLKIKEGRSFFVFGYF